MATGASGGPIASERAGAPSAPRRAERRPARSGAASSALLGVPLRADAGGAGSGAAAWASRAPSAPWIAISPPVSAARRAARSRPSARPPASRSGASPATGAHASTREHRLHAFGPGARHDARRRATGRGREERGDLGVDVAGAAGQVARGEDPAVRLGHREHVEAACVHPLPRAGGGVRGRDRPAPEIAGERLCLPAARELVDGRLRVARQADELAVERAGRGVEARGVLGGERAGEGARHRPERHRERGRREEREREGELGA